MEDMHFFWAALEALTSQPTQPPRSHYFEKLRATLVSTVDCGLPPSVRSTPGIGLLIDSEALWATAYPCGEGPQCPIRLRHTTLIVDSDGNMSAVDRQRVRWSSQNPRMSQPALDQLTAFRRDGRGIAPFINVATPEMIRDLIVTTLSDQLGEGVIPRWGELPSFLHHAGVNEPHALAAGMLADAIGRQVAHATTHQNTLRSKHESQSAGQFHASEEEAGHALPVCLSSLVAATATAGAAGESTAVAECQRAFDTLSTYCSSGVQYPTAFDVDLLTNLIVWSNQMAHEPAGRPTMAPGTLDRPGCRLILREGHKRAPHQMDGAGVTPAFVPGVERHITALRKEALELWEPGAVPTLTFESSTRALL